MIICTLVAALSVGIQNPPPFGGGPQGGPQGGPMGQEIKLLKEFDKDENGYLDSVERAAARKAVVERRPAGGRGGGRPGGGPGGPGGPGGGGPGGGRGMTPGTPGPKVSPSEVKTFGSQDLYDSGIVRTVFLDFENADWEAEMADFYNTDVEVPARVTVDGKIYPNVGVHFRGASSYFSVPAGNKRSLNLTADLADSKQRVLGYKTLNLLNSNGDPTYLSTILYSHIANKYIPAPRANFLKVVINGESWGIYVNVEQFNNDFVTRNFPQTLTEGKAGARWKVSGSPNGDGGLRYLGEDLAQYKQRYDMKSKSNDGDWKALINLTRVISETQLDQLEAALTPILDLDNVLKFLALDVVLMNSDGYWTRASDYNIYRDPKGVFRLIPHDMNEAFRAGGGPGGPRPGGPGGPPPDGLGGPPRPNVQPGSTQPGQRTSTPSLDPLVGMEDQRKPLRSRLLNVPSLRAKYLGYVKEIAERDLNWMVIGGLVTQNRVLIDAEMKADTRKNTSYEAFLAATSAETGSLKAFIEGRRNYLLSYREAGR